jgi:hypothetical protein
MVQRETRGISLAAAKANSVVKQAAPENYRTRSSAHDVALRVRSWPAQRADKAINSSKRSREPPV